MKKLVAVMAMTLTFSTIAATGAFAAQAADTTGVVTTEIVSIDLKQNTTLYDSISGKKVGLLEPQVISIEAASKDEHNTTWYRVFTWMGTAWMKDPNAYSKLVAVGPNTTIYNMPNGKQTGNLAAQTLPIINEQIDESGFTWYQINSYQGKAWILNPEQSQRVKLTAITPLYQAIDGKKVGELKPQTVTVRTVKYDAKGKRWANIPTWKGNLWIRW